MPPLARHNPTVDEQNTATFAAGSATGGDPTFAVNHTVFAENLPVPSEDTLVVAVNLR